MDARKTMGPCAFEMLFVTNVPHILEKIFFSLDYRSFQTCFRVNSAWNELLSSEYCQKRLTKMLFEKDQNEQKLWNESFDGNLIEVKRLISNGGWMDVDCKGVDRQTSTPLYLAAYGGHNDVVQVLLDAGADPNQAAAGGWTPLFMCVQYGTKEVVQLLLDRGADPNKENYIGCTPLQLAARCGFKEKVQLLIERGADPNKAAINGYTPLHGAATYGHKEVVNLLLNGGAQYHEENDHGYSMDTLHYAAKYGYTEVVELLCDRGADPNKTDRWGRTPLHYAAAEGHKEVVELLRHHTNPSHKMEMP